MAKQRMKSEGVNIVTPEFRASFPNLFQARAAKQGDKAKYGIQMLFRVSKTAESEKLGEAVVDIEPVKKLVRDVVIEKFGPDKAKWPKLGDKPGELQLPFRSVATEPTKKGKPGMDEGVVFCTASKSGEQVRPGVVYPHAGPDGRPAPMQVPTDFYGGCYARASINAYYWEYMGKMGVSLGLNHVQKTRDGEPFGGGEPAEDAFDAIPVPGGALPSTVAAGTDPSGI